MQSDDVLTSSQPHGQGQCRRVSACSISSRCQYEEIKNGGRDRDRDRKEETMMGSNSSYTSHAAADTQHKAHRQQQSSTVRISESKDTDDSDDSQVGRESQSRRSVEIEMNDSSEKENRVLMRH